MRVHNVFFESMLALVGVSALARCLSGYVTMWPMTKCLRICICLFVFVSLPKVYLRSNTQIQNQFQCTSVGLESVSMMIMTILVVGRNGLSEFTRSRPQGEQQQTEAKTNTVCICEQRLLSNRKIWNKLCFGRGPIWHREGYYLHKN